MRSGWGSGSGCRTRKGGSYSPVARLLDGRGRYRDVGHAGLPAGRGFGRAGDLRTGLVLPDREPAGRRRRPAESGPWTLQGIGVRTTGASRFSGDLIYDEVQYSRADALPPDWIATGFDDGVIIESFEEQGRWTLYTDITREVLPDDARLVTNQVHHGESALRYSWTREARAGIARGIRLVGPEDPIPVVAARSFLEEASLEVGSELQLGMSSVFIQAVVAGTFDLFPTWDPSEARALILANRDYLYYRVNRNPTTVGALTPTEIWIEPTDEAGLEQLRSWLALSAPWLHDVYDTAAIRNLQDEDPLVAAGWEGLLFITFIAIVLLSALGFLVASVLVAQAQQGEFAVLRTMGFSSRQVLIVVGMEKAADHHRVDGLGHGGGPAAGRDDA